jgi:hypothetical protein
VRLTTSSARREWSPACTFDKRTIALHGQGRITVRVECVEAFLALDDCLRAHHYLTRAADTGAYVCRAITGGTGYSLHAYGVAADINWQTNPYGPRLVTDMPRAMVDDILSIKTGNGEHVFGWGGNYRTNKDAMHFEVLCSRADLATGIRRVSIPPVTPARPKDWFDMATKEELREVVQEEIALAVMAITGDEFDVAAWKKPTGRPKVFSLKELARRLKVLG